MCVSVYMFSLCHFLMLQSQISKKIIIIITSHHHHHHHHHHHYHHLYSSSIIIKWMRITFQLFSFCTSEPDTHNCINFHFRPFDFPALQSQISKKIIPLSSMKEVISDIREGDTNRFKFRLVTTLRDRTFLFASDTRGYLSLL